MAGFMSGMAGNVSAFPPSGPTTLRRNYSTRKPTMRSTSAWAVGARSRVFISIVTAYFVMHFLSIMDYVQALFSFFIRPCMAPSFWACSGRAPRLPEAFGLAGWNGFIHRHVGLGEVESRAIAYVALSSHGQRHGAEYVTAHSGRGLVCVAVTVWSAFHEGKTRDRIRGLVYGATRIPSRKQIPLIHRPPLGRVVTVVFLALNYYFW